VGKILVKRSLFYGIIISLVIVGITAAFFAGSLSSSNSENITKSEFYDAIDQLESKMLKMQGIQPNPNPVKISLDNDAVKGNKDAPISIIEFSDFQCPFCARFHSQTLPLIIEQYVDTGKVKFVYRDFPIQGSHPNAMAAAVSSECANEQGKYWEYHDILFQQQGMWNNLEVDTAIEIFKEYAVDLDLKSEQFEECLDSGKYISEVNQDLNDGQNYGVTGTPGFFIGNEDIGFVKVNGAQPFETFKRVIDSQLFT
jgi:protein-disulfide isomerase